MNFIKKFKSDDGLGLFGLRHLRQSFLEPLTSQIRGFEFFPRELKMKTLLSEMEYDTCIFISDGSELRSFIVFKSQNP